MTETELQERVRLMCDQLGLAVQHIYDARRCWLVGFPDLVIVGQSVIWRELKSATGIVSADQRRVGRLLIAAGQDWAVWRPADLLSGVIARQLSAIAADPILFTERI